MILIVSIIVNWELRGRKKVCLMGCAFGSVELCIHAIDDTINAIIGSQQIRNKANSYKSRALDTMSVLSN